MKWTNLTSICKTHGIDHRGTIDVIAAANADVAARAPTLAEVVESLQAAEKRDNRGLRVRPDGSGWVIESFDPNFREWEYVASGSQEQSVVAKLNALWPAPEPDRPIPPEHIYRRDEEKPANPVVADCVVCPKCNWCGRAGELAEHRTKEHPEPKPAEPPCYVCGGVSEHHSPYCSRGMDISPAVDLAPYTMIAGAGVTP